MSQESERSIATVQEMVKRGTEYREDYTFEGYGGQEVTVILRPLVDDEFLPISAFLADALDLDDEIEQEEAVSEAIDKAEPEDEGEQIDITELDKEFVHWMQKAAKLGLHGGYDEDGNPVEFTDEEREETIDEMMGAYSVEIGGRVLEVSGDVRDAEKFRGGRGSVGDSRDS